MANDRSDAPAQASAADFAAIRASFQTIDPANITRDVGATKEAEALRRTGTALITLSDSTVRQARSANQSFDDVLEDRFGGLEVTLAAVNYWESVEAGHSKLGRVPDNRFEFSRVTFQGYDVTNEMHTDRLFVVDCRVVERFEISTVVIDGFTWAKPDWGTPETRANIESAARERIVDAATAAGIDVVHFEDRSIEPARRTWRPPMPSLKLRNAAHELEMRHEFAEAFPIHRTPQDRESRKSREVKLRQVAHLQSAFPNMELVAQSGDDPIPATEFKRARYGFHVTLPNGNPFELQIDSDRKADMGEAETALRVLAQRVGDYPEINLNRLYLSTKKLAYPGLSGHASGIANHLRGEMGVKLTRLDRSPSPRAPYETNVSTERIVNHEVGHFVYYYLREHAPDKLHQAVLAAVNPDGKRELDPIWDENGDVIAGPLADQIRANVSEYALQNILELTAELFGRHMAGPQYQTGMTQKFMRSINEIFYELRTERASYVS